MTVGSADAACIDSGSTGKVIRGPFRFCVAQVKRRVVNLHKGIYFCKMKIGRNDAVLHGKKHFYERAHTGGGFEVPDTGFHGPKAAVVSLACMFSEGLLQPLNFHRIPKGGSGSVGLYEGDGCRVDIGITPGRLNQPGNGCRIRHHDVVRPAVVVERSAFDHSPDGVPVGKRRRQRFQQKCPHTLA